MRSRVIKAAICGGLAILGSAAVAVAFTVGGSTGYVPVGPFFGKPVMLTGSCGNAYVADPPMTSYRVWPQKTDGSYIVEQLFHSAGSTLAGKSPEACSTGSGATLAAGIPVLTNEDELAIITHGTFNPRGDAPCTSPCFYAQFTPAFFGPTAVVTHLSTVAVQATACNGSIVDNGIGAFAGDIAGERSRC
jgi:hypothetical protein